MRDHLFVLGLRGGLGRKVFLPSREFLNLPRVIVVRMWIPCLPRE
jgi:hypothetical protein